MLLALILSAFFSFIGTFFLIPFLIKRSDSMGLIDYPGDRRVHQKPIPKIGGIAIVASFIPIFCGYLFSGYFVANFFSENIVFIITTSIIIGVGIYDDIYTISTFNKFFFQLIAAIVIVIYSDFKFIFHIGEANQFKEIFSIILTIIFIVGVTNAINLMDGLDGLVGSVYIIIAATFLGLSAIIGVSYLFLFFLVPFISGTCAFLKYNKFPAKVFLGDTGSLLMGWSFAMMTILFSQKAEFELSVFIPFIILSVPIADTLLVMLTRFLNSFNHSLINRLKAMFKADNNHLHHLILNSCQNTKKTVFIICSIVLASSCISFISLMYHFKIILIINLILTFIITILARFIFRLKIKS